MKRDEWGGEREREKSLLWPAGERQKNDKPPCRKLTLAAKLFNFLLSVRFFPLSPQRDVYVRVEGAVLWQWVDIASGKCLSRRAKNHFGLDRGPLSWPRDISALIFV